MIVDMESHVRLVCQSCGHTWPWHTTDDRGCTHEIQDENETWMRCNCRSWRA